MTTEIGTRCRLVAMFWQAEDLTLLDHVDAEPGDFLRTQAGTCYRIDEIRPCRPDAKALAVLICTRLGKDAVELDDQGVHLWTWRPR